MPWTPVPKPGVTRVLAEQMGLLGLVKMLAREYPVESAALEPHAQLRDRHQDRRAAERAERPSEDAARPGAQALEVFERTDRLLAPVLLIRCHREEEQLLIPGRKLLLEFGHLEPFEAGLAVGDDVARNERQLAGAHQRRLCLEERRRQRTDIE